MLLQFPNELLSHILRSVDDDDAGSMMLINHQIHQLMLPVFNNLHFSTLRIKFTFMDRLEKIASCDAYRRAVREIQMVMHDEYPHKGPDLDWLRHEDGSLLPNATMSKVRRLMATRFPNCSKISVHGYGCHGYIRPWSNLYYIIVSEILGFAFEAVAQAATPILSFKLDFSPVHSLPDRGRQSIPRDLPSGFWTAWSNLQTLHIAARGHTQEHDSSDLADLILKADGLKKLRLEHSFAITPDTPLSLYAILIGASDIPKITHLHIKRNYFSSSSDLIQLLAVFKDHLEHLLISHTMIQSGDWRDVCVALRQSFPKLKSVALSWCCIADDFTSRVCESQLQLFHPLKGSLSESECSDFQFYEMYNRKVGNHFCVAGVRYTGKNLQWALQIIEDAIYTDTSSYKDAELERGFSWILPPILPRTCKFQELEFGF